MVDNHMILLLLVIIASLLAAYLISPPLRVQWLKLSCNEVAELAAQLEEELRIEGVSRVIFFKISPSALCMSAVGGLPLIDCWGKEWVVKAYKDDLLVYEMRIDAALGPSGIYIDLKQVNEEKAVNTALFFLAKVHPSHCVFSLGDALNVSCGLPPPPQCRSVLQVLTSRPLVEGFLGIGVQILFVTALIVGSALNVTGISKVRLVLMCFIAIFLVSLLQLVLTLDYRLGINELSPTVRSLARMVYAYLIQSLQVSIILLAGTALISKKRGFTFHPRLNVRPKTWLLSVTVGSVLTLWTVLMQLVYIASGAIVLSMPLIEEVVNSAIPWLSIALLYASATLSEEVIFRLFLKDLLAELTGSEVQAVGLSSSLYALAYVSYPLYPPYLAPFQAFVLALVLSVLREKAGLAATIIARFSYGSLVAALAIRNIAPVDAMLLALAPTALLPMFSLIEHATNLVRQ